MPFKSKAQRRKCRLARAMFTTYVFKGGDAVPASGTPMPSQTILLVDDEHLIRRFMRRSLTEAGYRILEAADGIEALDCLREVEEISLVITDIRMPRMDGYALVGRMRDEHFGQPIIFVSGYSKENLESPWPVLLKPLPTQDLLSAVSDALNVRG